MIATSSSSAAHSQRGLASQRTRGAVYAALLAVLATHLCFARLAALPLSGDEATYALITDEAIETGNWAFPTRGGEPYLFKPPLYFWLTAIFHRLAGDEEQAHRIVAAAAGVAAIVLTCLLGSLKFSPEIGLVSGLMLCLHQPLVFFSSHGLRRGTMDSGITLLATASLLLAARAPSSRSLLRWWVGVGLLTGAMSMLKPFVGFLLLGLLALDHLVSSPRGMSRATFLPPLAAFAASLSVWAPWHLAVVLHYPWELIRQTFDSQIVQRVTAGIPRHVEGPFFYPLVMTRGSILFWPFLPALAAGVAFSLRGASRRPFRQLTLVIVGWVLAFSLSTSKLPWYVFPVFPCTAVLIAATAAELLKRIRPGPLPWEKRPRVAVIAVVIVFAVLGPLLVRLAHDKVALLAGELEYLPWTIYRATLEAGDTRLVLVGFPTAQNRQTSLFYERRMDRALRLDDPAAIRRQLADPAPLAIVLGDAVDPRLERQLESQLRRRGGLRLAGRGVSISLSGCEHLLPPHLSARAEQL